jgi:hypothetical protein
MQAPASQVAKRPSLTRLVQQIGEIVAQGEDSGSQSQASDGGLRARLRTVLLALLDGIINSNAGATCHLQTCSMLPSMPPALGSSGGAAAAQPVPAADPAWALQCCDSR